MGSGEPTLHSGLGEMIRHVKSRTTIPLAVITNGSLLYLPEVREDLKRADAVLPTLDAGSEILYQKINRPAAELTFERLVSGLVAFREMYQGRLWIEVMLIQGLNDSEAALHDLAAVLHRIQPDQIHINLPTRPPCEPWVRPASAADLQRAMHILGKAAHVVQPADCTLDSPDTGDLGETVANIIMRHPMSEEELVRLLAQWPKDQVLATLAELKQSGRAQVVSRYGQRFWSFSGARYVDEELSRRHSRQPTVDTP